MDNTHLHRQRTRSAIEHIPEPGEVSPTTAPGTTPQRRRRNNCPGRWRDACGSSRTATSATHVDCPYQPSRRHSRQCSTRRSTMASSGKVRMACSAPGSNTALAIAGGRSALTPETSRTRTTSREPSAHRPRHLPDVLDLRASSLSISPYADRAVAHHEHGSCDASALCSGGHSTRAPHGQTHSR